VFRIILKSMKMKKFGFLLSIVMLVAACNSEPHYIIRGSIAGSDSVTFYIQKRDAGKIVNLDSAISKKGSFTMKGGEVKYPELVQLVAGNSRKRTSFYLENSEISITGNIDSLFNAKITGSKTQDEFSALSELNKPLGDLYSKAYQEYQVARRENNAAKMVALEKQADSLQTEMMKLQKDYVKAHPASYITPALVVSMSYELGAEELEGMINGLDTAISNLPQIKTLKDRVEAMKTVSVGKKAPDFTMEDVNGKPVSLYSKLGPKVLLVDFWAAWCNPCRQENPNVVKIYNEFHKKGFDILGVSLDRKKEDWLKAINDDKLTWTHVSDLKYWDNAAARLYSVYSIPSNVLIDPNGIIIGRNVMGTELYNKVKEIVEQ
jgi:peroxiredoxin